MFGKTKIFLVLVVACLLFVGCAAMQPMGDGSRRVDPVVETLKTLQSINAASASINPYAAIISIALATVGAGYGAIKRAEANKVGRKYNAHKQGVEKYMRDSDPQVAEAIYDNIGDARKVNKVS